MDIIQTPLPFSAYEHLVMAAAMSWTMTASSFKATRLVGGKCTNKTDFSKGESFSRSRSQPALRLRK
jgi:hypothetical protein